jgi:magnesium transporter
MDAFASVISNNLNIVMKVLTVITIVMAIPNIIFSFYGMNVAGLPFPQWWFPTGLAIVACIIATIIFIKKDMFH